MQPAAQCGQFALKNLLERAGFDQGTVESAVAALGADWLTTSEQIVDAAGSQGVGLNAFECPDPFILEPPFIVWYRESHFVVVDAFDARSVAVLDNQAANGRARLSRQNFMFKYGGVAIVLVGQTGATRPTITGR